jgi:hypothetical protein
MEVSLKLVELSLCLVILRQSDVAKESNRIHLHHCLGYTS